MTKEKKRNKAEKTDQEYKKEKKNRSKTSERSLDLRRRRHSGFLGMRGTRDALGSVSCRTGRSPQRRIGFCSVFVETVFFSLESCWFCLRNRPSGSPCGARGSHRGAARRSRRRRFVRRSQGGSWCRRRFPRRSCVQTGHQRRFSAIIFVLLVHQTRSFLVQSRIRIRFNQETLHRLQIRASSKLDCILEFEFEI